MTDSNWKQLGRSKVVYTLNVDDYSPEITRLTYPLLQGWAQKIGADFYVISDRKWPDYAPVYEKLQIHQLAREQKREWSIYVDSDTLIHPDFFDPTEHIKKDTVLHNGCDMAGVRWRYDDYFRRDGRHIGSCNWFTCGSNWCLDLWRPLDDITYEQALAQIFPTKFERDSGVIDTPHLIDDFILSRNIARFGLKFMTNVQLLRELKDEFGYLWHQYTLKPHDKILQMHRMLLEWGVEKVDITRALTVEGFMRPSELGWLAAQATTRKRIAEIGSYYGRSTRALADATVKECEIHTYDDFYGPREITLDEALRREIYDKFRTNLGDHIESGHVIVHKVSYKDLQPEGQFDMIFLDGSHEYRHFSADLDRWVPHLSDDGILCGHDFNDGFVGINRALRERDWPIQVIPNTRIWKVDAEKIKTPSGAGMLVGAPER